MWMQALWWELTIAGESVQQVVSGIYGMIQWHLNMCSGPSKIYETQTHSRCAKSVCWITTVFTASIRCNHLTNVRALILAFPADVAECKVSWCAVLSPPPTGSHGSWGMHSTGIYPPARLLCVRLLTAIRFTRVREPDRRTEEECLTRRQEHERRCPAKSSKQTAWMRQCWWRQKWHWRLQ